MWDRLLLISSLLYYPETKSILSYTNFDRNTVTRENPALLIAGSSYTVKTFRPCTLLMIVISFDLLNIKNRIIKYA